MSFSFASARQRRRPSLTPMIDVVFLLLVFFMLAARFGQDGALSLNAASGIGDSWTGPPRLVDIAPGNLRLNGITVTDTTLGPGLAELIEEYTDPIILRPAEGTDLQRLVDVMTLLDAVGFRTLLVIEP